MTKEEAILILGEFKEFCDSILWDSIYAERSRAIDMAIEALSAPQTDLVNRADAIEAVRKLNDISCDEANRLARIQHADMWKDDIIRNRAECYGYQKAMEVIEALPSAEAEQVTGKLNKRDDSLLKSDSDECKEQKSKLDLISRQAAIRKCCGEKCGCEREDCGYTECCLEVSRLESLPSSPDSRQRGKWVRNNKIGTFKIFTCDKCGCNMDTDAWDFCPNCGADMRGEEE